jgi:hypothetical protein
MSFGMVIASISIDRKQTITHVQNEHDGWTLTKID